MTPVNHMNSLSNFLTMGGREVVELSSAYDKLFSGHGVNGVPTTNHMRGSTCQNAFGKCLIKYLISQKCLESTSSSDK